MSNQNHNVPGSLFGDADSAWNLNIGLPYGIIGADVSPIDVSGLAAVPGADNVRSPNVSAITGDITTGAPPASGSYQSVFATSGNLTFNLEFDTAAQNAPAAFRTGVANAASLLASAMSVANVCTINVTIEYNEDNIGAGGAEGGPENGSFAPYQLIQSDLVADARAGDPNFNFLPSGTIYQGYTQVLIWNAEAKALGLLSGSNSALDGLVNFSSAIPSNLLQGVALHELAHSLGRVPEAGTPDVFELFRFSSPGSILVDDSTIAPASYFSVNGGVTDLADYGRYSDPSDFLNSTAIGSDVASLLTPNDPFNQYYDSNTIQTLTAVDLKQLDVLGFGTACYCAGTRILTDRGETRVEDLRPGTLVVTASGEKRPVRWIGWREIDFTRHSDPDAVRPIRIVAGAFGRGLPRTDLRLSPDHAVYTDGRLFPARTLVNGMTIRQETSCPSATYYHIELDTHDVLLAEGLPAESFLDTGNRSMFANGGEPVRLHPGFGRTAWEGHGCAPLIVTGPALETVRARLGAIAAEFAQPTKSAARRSG